MSRTRRKRRARKTRRKRIRRGGAGESVVAKSVETIKDAGGAGESVVAKSVETIKDTGGAVKGVVSESIEKVEEVGGRAHGAVTYAKEKVKGVVVQAKDKIVSGGEESMMEAGCEIIGLGPEDPLADICAALVAAGFSLKPKIQGLAERGDLPGISWPKKNSLPSIGIPKLPFHLPHIRPLHLPHLHFPHLHIPKIFHFSRHPWLWPKDGQCPSPLPWNDSAPSKLQDVPPDPVVPSAQAGPTHSSTGGKKWSSMKNLMKVSPGAPCMFNKQCPSEKPKCAKNRKWGIQGKCLSEADAALLKSGANPAKGGRRRRKRQTRRKKCKARRNTQRRYL